MKISASNLDEFNKIDSLLQKITNKEFVKGLDAVEIIAGSSILRASKRIFVDKIVLPKNILIDEVSFSKQSHYEKEHNSTEIKEKLSYTAEVSGRIVNEEGISQATIILYFHGFPQPNLKISYY